MFIKFEFGNFRSFRDHQQFSMEAMPLRSNDNGLIENNVFSQDSIRLLRTKAVFGANASGKSNVAKAFGAFQLMVNRSVVEENLPATIWKERFQLVTDWEDQPIFFQYIFLFDSIIYRYGFQILGGGVNYEWLYSGMGKTETEWFLRTPTSLKVYDEPFKFADPHFQSAPVNEGELFRSDSLYLTAGALNNNKTFGAIRNQIRDLIVVDGIDDDKALSYAMTQFLNGPKAKHRALIELVAAADTGIEDLKVDELPLHDYPHMNVSEIKLFSHHTIYDWDGKKADRKPFGFREWESEGTGKFLGVGALVLDALAFGHTIIIDEFDARLHPNLSLKIVELFQDQKTNPKNAQLIFVTHDASLLRRAELRRDQVFFVNKDSFGVSTGVNLVEFKGVRKDASYEKEYLNGTYTGIPFLDKINHVVTASNQHHGL